MQEPFNNFLLMHASWSYSCGMAMNHVVLQAMDDARNQWRNVAPALRALKRHLALTDQQIADVLGLTRQTVQNRLNGSTHLSYWELAGLAAFFEVPADVLFDGAEASVRWILDHPSATRGVSLSDPFPEQPQRRSGWLAVTAA